MPGTIANQYVGKETWTPSYQLSNVVGQVSGRDLSMGYAMGAYPGGGGPGATPAGGGAPMRADGYDKTYSPVVMPWAQSQFQPAAGAVSRPPTRVIGGVPMSVGSPTPPPPSSGSPTLNQAMGYTPGGPAHPVPPTSGPSRPADPSDARLEQSIREIARQLPMNFPTDLREQQRRFCTTFSYPMRLMRSADPQVRRQGQNALIAAVRNAPCNLLPQGGLTRDPRINPPAPKITDDERFWAAFRKRSQEPDWREERLRLGRECQRKLEALPTIDPRHPIHQRVAPSPELIAGWQRAGWRKENGNWVVPPGATEIPECKPSWLRFKEEEYLGGVRSPAPAPASEPAAASTGTWQGTQTLALPVPPGDGVQPVIASPTPDGAQMPADVMPYGFPGPFPMPGLPPPAVYQGGYTGGDTGWTPHADGTLSTRDLTVYFENEGVSWPAYEV